MKTPPTFNPIIAFVVASSALFVGASILGQDANAPPVQWQRTYGNSAGGWLAGLQQTSDGGYIFGGTFGTGGYNGNKDSLGFGGYDYWVVRTDKDGVKLWDRAFGGTNDDVLTAVKQTRDGGFILGGRSVSGVSGNKVAPKIALASVWNDFWIVRLDGDGNKLWERSFGGTNEISWLQTLEQTADGGFVLGGYTFPFPMPQGIYAHTHYGQTDFLVIRLDADGNEVWNRTFGGTNSEDLLSLQETTDGGFIFGGWSNSEPSGNKTSPNFGGSDFWVVRTDSRGQKLWDQSFGGSGIDGLNSLRQTSDGGFILGGGSASPADGNKASPLLRGGFWIVRLGADGTKLWDRSYDKGAAVASLWQTFDGGYILGGDWGPGGGDSAGFTDFYVLRVDASGNKIWEAAYGGPLVERLFSLQQTIDGGFVLGGYTGNAVPLFWVVKLASEDADGDGVPDINDQCPNTPTGDTVDADGCSLNQLVPCDGLWRSHGEYVRALAKAATHFLREGLIDRQQWRAILREGVKSDCGKKTRGK